MEHGTVVDGEESDEEVLVAETALHDLTRPVHAVFTPAALGGEPEEGAQGTVCQGEEDSDDEGETVQPPSAHDDTATPSPVSAHSPVAPIVPEVKHSDPTPAPEPAAPPARLSPRRSKFQNAMDDCHAGAFDSPIQSQTFGKAERKVTPPRGTRIVKEPGDESPLQMCDSPPPPASQVPTEANPPHDPQAFRNALILMMNRKKKDVDAMPHAIPKPFLPLKEPQETSEVGAKAAARGDFTKINHHSLCADLNDVKYSAAKNVFEATFTIAAAVSSNADVHAHRIRAVQSTTQTTTELGNVLNEAMKELVKEVGFADKTRSRRRM